MRVEIDDADLLIRPFSLETGIARKRRLVSATEDEHAFLCLERGCDLFGEKGVDRKYSFPQLEQVAPEPPPPNP